MSNQASITFFYVGVGNYTNGEGVIPETGLLNVDLAVYLDGSTKPIANFSAAQESPPVRQTFTISEMAVSNSDDFSAANTIIYPFDQYTVESSFYALDKSGDVVPIVEANIDGSPQGWQIEGYDVAFNICKCLALVRTCTLRSP